MCESSPVRLRPSDATVAIHVCLESVRTLRWRVTGGRTETRRTTNSGARVVWTSRQYDRQTGRWAPAIQDTRVYGTDKWSHGTRVLAPDRRLHTQDLFVDTKFLGIVLSHSPLKEYGLGRRLHIHLRFN